MVKSTLLTAFLTVYLFYSAYAHFESHENDDEIAAAAGAASVLNMGVATTPPSNKAGHSLMSVLRASEMKEGAGVTVRRTIGTNQLRDFDPFLLLDEFLLGQNSPGFPTHPHRGQCTLTTVVPRGTDHGGAVVHLDSKGNRGEIFGGMSQWTRVGKGILHSEMPLDPTKAVRGLQLWINLDHDGKKADPLYLDVAVKDIPIATPAPGVVVSVTSGQFVTVPAAESGPVVGPINDEVAPGLYHWMVNSSDATEQTSWTQAVPAGWSVAAYVLEGSISVNDQAVPQFSMALLKDGKDAPRKDRGLEPSSFLTLSVAPDSEFLFIAAPPLKEPVFRRGPFVLDSQAALDQAFKDHRAGVLDK